MDNYNSSADVWKLNSQQHISLDKHDSMIQNALKWQSVTDERENGQTGMVTALRTRVAGFLQTLSVAVAGKSAPTLTDRNMPEHNRANAG